MFAGRYGIFRIVWLRFGVSSGRDPLEAPSLAIHNRFLLSSYVGAASGLNPEAETLSSSIDSKSKFN